MSILSTISKLFPIVLIAALIVGLSYALFKSLKSPEELLTFSVVFQIDEADTFQLFYSKSNNLFREKNSKRFKVMGGEDFQKIKIKVPIEYPYLRFNIGENPAQKQVDIQSIGLSSKHHPEKILSGQELTDLLVANKYVSNTKISDTEQTENHISHLTYHTRKLNGIYHPALSNISTTEILGITVPTSEMFFTCQVDKDDAFTIYHRNKETDYNINDSKKIELIGSPDFQTIKVEIPNDQPIIRFDLGENKEQEKIIFKEIGFAKSDGQRQTYELQELKGELTLNEFIEKIDYRSNALTFYMQQKQEYYDPFFRGLNANDLLAIAVNEENALWKKYNLHFLIASILLGLIFMMLAIRYQSNDLQSHFTFNVLFMVMLLAPFIQQKTGLVDFTKIPKENRKPTAKPILTFNKEYAQSFDAYYKDHFGFRPLLINIGKKIKFYGFKTSPNDKNVLKGKGDWLFFNATKIRSSYGNWDLLTAKELEVLCQRWNRNNKYTERKGIKYYKMFYPNKHSIYPEMMSNRMSNSIRDTISKTDQILEHMEECVPSLNIIDCRPALMEAKKNHLLYKKQDTHWNHYGAFVAYEAILPMIANDFPELSPKKIEAFTVDWKEDSYDTDLIMMMGLNWERFNDTFPFLTPKNPDLNAYTKMNTDGFPHKTLIHHNPNAQTNLTAVIFRDSYTRALEKLYSLHFKNTYYIWTPYNQNIVTKVNPDLVIDGHVERLFDSR